VTRGIGLSMKSILKYLLTVGMITLIINGCAGAGDYDIKLSGGYSLIRSSAQMVTINKDEGKNLWGPALIPAKVTELAWDDKYVLAKQVGLKREYPDNPNNSYEVLDESKIGFWILQEGDGKVFGPLTEYEFTKKKQELSIPTDLKLKSVASYKKD
jgi:hypothetical protein